jgi:hypothetical protein
MKTYEINVSCYEVTEPDGGGINSNHIAYFSSASVARQYVDMTNKGWPKDIRQKNITHKYIILDSVSEFRGVIERWRTSCSPCT